MASGNGGNLNHDWVEWLMGWPVGWTRLEPLSKISGNPTNTESAA